MNEDRRKKKEICIAFASFTCEANKRIILTILKKEFKVVINNEVYDYFFVDDVVYYNLRNMQEVLEARKNSIKIMIAFEAVFPDLNIFDYAICFFNKFICQDRILHLPYMEFLNCMGYKDIFANIDNSSVVCGIREHKDKFCNFIYGNSNGHQMRTDLFLAVSKYKTVDSLGKLYNNVQIDNTRENEDWLEKSIELKRPYKFSIAAENAEFPGYTSEKLMTSMIAGTIPIYWGNPYVAEEYNDEAFINVMKYQSLDDVVERIKRLDKDENAYMEMISKPWRTLEQVEQYNINIDKFYDSFYKIFNSKKEEARRVPVGCWPDTMYPKFFYPDNKRKNMITLVNEILRGFFSR